MDVRFCKEQEPPPRGTRCELRVLRVLVLRAPHRRALGELFFLLTNDLHGCRPLVQSVQLEMRSQSTPSMSAVRDPGAVRTVHRYDGGWSLQNGSLVFLLPLREQSIGFKPICLLLYSEA